MLLNLIKYIFILILYCYYYYAIWNSPKLSLNLQEADVNEKRKADDDDMEYRKFNFILKKLMLLFQHPRLALIIISMPAILNLCFVFSNYYSKLLCSLINFKALNIIKNCLLYRHWAIPTFYTLMTFQLENWIF